MRTNNIGRRLLGEQPKVRYSLACTWMDHVHPQYGCLVLYFDEDRHLVGHGYLRDEVRLPNCVEADAAYLRIDFDPPASVPPEQYAQVVETLALNREQGILLIEELRNAAVPGFVCERLARTSLMRVLALVDAIEARLKREEQHDV